jgi:hypothetical protein
VYGVVLHEGGKALVEPEIRPPRHRHQVSKPSHTNTLVKSVLGIHDPLVRIRIWIRGFFDLDLDLALAPDPDPTPDPTPFFSDFKDAKKKFSYFFLLTYPQQAHYLQHQRFNFLVKFCIPKFYNISIISVR